MLAVINFTSNEHFGKVDIGPRGLEENGTEDREWEGLSTVICVIHGTFHGGLSIELHAVDNPLYITIILF